MLGALAAGGKRFGYETMTGAVARWRVLRMTAIQPHSENLELMIGYLRNIPNYMITLVVVRIR